MDSLKLDYLISLDWHKIHRYEENLNFLIRILNNISKSSNINILIYNITDTNSNSYEELEKKYSTFNNIFLFKNKFNNFIDAAKFEFNKEKSFFIRDLVFIIDSSFLLKSTFDKFKIDNIIKDFSLNEQIKWVNFLSESYGEFNAEKFNLGAEPILNTKFSYIECFNPNIFFSIIRLNTFKFFLKNLIYNSEIKNNNHFNLDYLNYMDYGAYLFANEKLRSKEIQTNFKKQSISYDIPMIYGNFNGWKREAMISYKKGYVYMHIVNLFFFEQISFKILFNNEEIDFKLNVNDVEKDTFKKNKSTFYITKNILLFNSKNKKIFIKTINSGYKLKDICFFFENSFQPKDEVPLNINYLFDLFPQEIYKKYKDFFIFSNFSNNFFGYLEDKSFYSQIFNYTKDIDKTSKIPKIVHLTYGFSDNPEFYFFNYLSVLSIIEKIKPNKILFYYLNEPRGIWWDMIKSKLTLIKVRNGNYFLDNQIEHYAHISDTIRLEALRYCGGIYLDLDIIVNKSFDSLLNNKFVMATQNTSIPKDDRYKRSDYGLCNAVMLSMKNSKFSENFLMAYKSFDKNQQKKWDYFSVVVPYKIMEKNKNEITVLKDECFFPFYWYDLKNKIFGENIFDFVKLKNSFCFHLWENGEAYGERNLDFLKLIDFNYIENNKNNFTNFIKSNHFFRDCSDDLISILFLINDNFLKIKKSLDSYIKYIDRKEIKELIIFNNNPEDINIKKYLNTIKHFNKIKILTNDNNIGLNEIRKNLFQKALGDIIFSIDSNFIINNEAFFDDIKIILANKNIGICGPIGINMHAYKEIEENEKEQIVDSIIGCCQIFRRDLLNVMNIKEDSPFYWGEDIKMCMQAKENKFVNFKFKSKNSSCEWYYNPLIHQPNFDYLNKKYDSKVPLKIFQTWGTKKLSLKMSEVVDDIKKNNPEFEYYLFDDKDCENFIKKYFPQNVLNAYKRIIPGAYKADLWRYCVLYVEGGIYLDIKFKPFKGFKLIELTEDEHYVLDIPESGGGIYNGFMISKPNNQKLLTAINQIVSNVEKEFYGYSSLEPTGCILLKSIFYNEKSVDLALSLKWGMTSILKDKKIILYAYKEYRPEQQTYYKEKNTDHYFTLWNNRNIYYPSLEFNNSKSDSIL